MNASSRSVVALIPARAGSKRVPNKNIRLLRGHPLIAYTICAARQSGVFDGVFVCTDSKLYADIARHYGAEIPFMRPETISGDRSADIEWVELAISELERVGRSADCFSILRPTSPFRKPETIQRAWQEFSAAEGVDSIRAVEKCEQHPGKMWVVRGERMTPLLPLSPDETPWHSQQYASLPAVYVQNASLEIAATRVVSETRTIAGNSLMPFLTEGDEGMDINRPEDWWYAELCIDRGEARLPTIDREPFPMDRLPA